MDSSAAKKALNDKKVTGIIYTEDASLVVDENSYNATILESILTQYKQQKDVFTNIAKTNPAALDTAIAGLSDTTSEYKEISLSSGNQDEYTNYFYAVFAMSCLFASPCPPHFPLPQPQTVCLQTQVLSAYEKALQL